MSFPYKNENMNRNFSKILLSLMFLFVIEIVFSQTPVPNPPPGPPGLPIDGGILGLFLVAIGFAYKSLKAKKK
jgi:hypothetical protein